MKLSANLFFSFLVITSIAYSMDNTKIRTLKGWELEVVYTSFYAELNNEMKKFVDKFNMWPPEEKSKIKIIKKNNISEHMAIYDSIIVSKYNGPIIDYLNYHFENDKIIQFKWVIEYLKKYQYCNTAEKRTVCTMIRPF